MGADLAAAGVADAANRALRLRTLLTSPAAGRADARPLRDAAGALRAGLEAVLGSALLLAGAAIGAIGRAARDGHR
jgi:hypothetical protein